ncbi:hypothetical protein DU002_00620 [Corallincola holothuriorum]|uniref:Uncharacterized protein n=1 Tax=Corallincola holothuriorum TaxID=2282215 RepID=A0A368NPL9_9GAMM|nr:hypothetical protein [Corallincola holothuriorum]RCU52507.1 hypothetical protein DU002_00620 [Corallincola holothuriorum]
MLHKLCCLISLMLLFVAGHSQADPFYHQMKNSPVPAYTIKGMKNCQQHMKVTDHHYIAVCRAAMLDTDINYGWRAVLTSDAVDGTSPVSVSDGFGDVYQVALQLRGYDSKVLLLVESVTEYFDGVAVYKLDQSQLHDMGYIALSAGPAEADESLLPLMRIMEKGGALVVNFSGPVTYVNDKGVALTLRPEQIKYVGIDRLIKQVR